MTTAVQTIRVLLVEDDEDDYLITRDTLVGQERAQFSVEWCPDFDDALIAIAEQRHDVYLIDHRLGRRTGLELVRQAFAEREEKFVRSYIGEADVKNARGGKLLGDNELRRKRVFLVGKSGGGGRKIFWEICVSCWESTKYFFGVVALVRGRVAPGECAAEGRLNQRAIRCLSVLPGGG